MSFYSGYPRYVSVAKRRAQAEKLIKRLQKSGVVLQPVVLRDPRKIASTFWGAAWCANLESHADFESRLPRGRTYVRHGSVVDLQILHGKIRARVQGSDLYDVDLTIKPLTKARWRQVVDQCTGQIHSIVNLLDGSLPPDVLDVLTAHGRGILPLPREIKMNCSCPDWATLCKHVAAVLYGVGARLDEQQEMLFTLRGVDHAELIATAMERSIAAFSDEGKTALEEQDLGALFGIELGEGEPAKNVSTRKRKAPVKRQPSAEKAPARKKVLGKAKPLTKVKASAKPQTRAAKKTTRRH